VLAGAATDKAMPRSRSTESRGKWLPCCAGAIAFVAVPPHGLDADDLTALAEASRRPQTLSTGEGMCPTRPTCSALRCPSVRTEPEEA